MRKQFVEVVEGAEQAILVQCAECRLLVGNDGAGQDWHLSHFHPGVALRRGKNKERKMFQRFTYLPLKFPPRLM
jgi:hypothetical protein